MKYILYVIIALIMVTGTMTVTSFLGDPFGIQERRTEEAISEAFKAKGDAATSNAQAGVGIDWAAISAGASTRDAKISSTRSANATAIQKAKGADARIDDDLVNTINNSLCNHKSTGCPSGG